MRHVLSADRQDGEHALYAAGSTGAPFPSGPKATTQDELLLVGPSELIGLLAPRPRRRPTAPRTQPSRCPATGRSGSPPDGRPRCRFPYGAIIRNSSWAAESLWASGGQSMEATSGRTLRATPDAPGWASHTKGPPGPADNAGNLDGSHRFLTGAPEGLRRLGQLKRAMSPFTQIASIPRSTTKHPTPAREPVNDLFPEPGSSS